jgi:hypothetical protein
MTSMCPVKFQRENGVVITIRQFTYMYKNLSYEEQTSSNILKVSKTEISRNRDILCIKILSTLRRITMCTISMGHVVG